MLIVIAIIALTLWIASLVRRQLVGTPVEAEASPDRARQLRLASLRERHRRAVEAGAVAAADQLEAEIRECTKNLQP